MTQVSSSTDGFFKQPPIAPGQRGIGGLFLILFFYLLLGGCASPEPSGVDFGEIDPSQDPAQRLLTLQEPIDIKVKRGEFKLTPVAEYKIAALVVCNESYSDGWEAEISPVDLGLAWGKVVDPDFLKYISFSPGGRWVSFRLEERSPLDVSYVISHASNHHLIPATQNLWKTVKTIRKKKKVMLEGLLVNVAGTYEGKTVWWRTSVSRTDTGNGACEVLYVTKVKIDNKVYE